MSSVPVEPVCTFTPSFLNYDRPTALVVFRAHNFLVCSCDEFQASSMNLLIPAHAALTKSPRIKPSFGKITLTPTFSLMPLLLSYCVPRSGFAPGELPLVTRPQVPPALTTVHNAENAACSLNKGIAQAQKPPLKLLHAQLASPKRPWDTRGAGVAVGRVTSSMSVIINAGTYAHHVQQQAGCNSRWLSHQSHLFLSFFFCTFGLIYIFSR